MIESHDFAPAQLLFGNALHLDRNMFIDLKTSDQQYIDLDDYHKRLLSAQTSILEIAKTIQAEKDQHHLLAQPQQITEFAVGSFVLAEYKTAKPSKLHHTLRGPLKVISRTADGRHYQLLNLITNREESVHITLLRQFFWDATTTSPEAVATEDKEAWFIESILGHKGDPKGTRAKLSFHVLWKNGERTWEPWRNAQDQSLSLYHTEQLHTYMRATPGFLSLIPPQYR